MENLILKLENRTTFASKIIFFWDEIKSRNYYFVTRNTIYPQVQKRTHI